MLFWSYSDGESERKPRAGVHRLSKNIGAKQISSHQNDDMKQDPQWETTNLERHYTRFSQMRELARGIRAPLAYSACENQTEGNKEIECILGKLNSFTASTGDRHEETFFYICHTNASSRNGVGED